MAHPAIHSGERFAGIREVPAQAIQALSYLIAVIHLARLIGTAIPPRVSGIPYVKEH
jgi:simple sugar transport system permease protein